VRRRWAKLLNRVFEIDLEPCPKCGGELKIIGATLEQSVVDKTVTQLGLQAQPPLCSGSTASPFVGVSICRSGPAHGR
jgi:hypothetical protein